MGFQLLAEVAKLPKELCKKMGVRMGVSMGVWKWGTER